MLDLTIFDYGVGNLHSLAKALELVGARPTVTADLAELTRARVAALPGVGAFGHVARVLAPARDELRARMREGWPVLAVCIGMQALCESSEEGPGDGIGLIPGRVTRLRHRRLPQIGWNQVAMRPDPVFEGIAPGESFYFVNSFAPSACSEHVIAEADYGGPFAAAVHVANVWGFQFHPEKSSRAGIAMLANFVRLASAQVGDPAHNAPGSETPNAGR